MRTLAPELFAIYFSPYSAHAIKHESIVYPTVEHAYHCARYGEENIRNEIFAAPSPVKAWKISQKYKQQQLPDFLQRKREVMKMLCKLKLEQHADIKQVLIESGDLQIVKHITSGPPGDGYWDDGVDGQGSNELGKIWMELRDEIRIMNYVNQTK